MKLPKQLTAKRISTALILIGTALAIYGSVTTKHLLSAKIYSVEGWCFVLFWSLMWRLEVNMANFYREQLYRQMEFVDQILAVIEEYATPAKTQEPTAPKKRASKTKPAKTRKGKN